MDVNQKLDLEQKWHDAEGFARDNNGIIVRVYSSKVFEEAETYLFAALGNVSGLSVLDYGSGTGGTAEMLVRSGASVTGFDISRLRLIQAKARFDKEGCSSAARFLLSAAESLPFADHSFDAILGKQILHHLELSPAIPEITRVLRPGGRAVFLEPLIHNPLLQAYRRLTPHFRSPTERALSMKDLRYIGSHFRSMAHKEFCLFSVVPILFGAATRPRPIFDRASILLQRFDRRLMDRMPWVGRFAWETVLVLQR